MPPSARAAREHSENMFGRLRSTSRSPETPFYLLSGREGPPETQNTNLGHLAAKMPRSSPENSPSSESGSRAFQNTFKGPNSTISRPDAYFPAGARGQRRAKKEIGETSPGRRPDGLPKMP